MTPPEIAIGAGMPRNNVDQLLFKMARDGEVLKTRRGRYVHPSNQPPDKNDKKIRNRKNGPAAGAKQSH